MMERWTDMGVGTSRHYSEAEMERSANDCVESYERNYLREDTTLHLFRQIHGRYGDYRSIVECVTDYIVHATDASDDFDPSLHPHAIY